MHSGHKQERLASLVSNVAAPPVLAVLSAVLLVMNSTEAGVWQWAALFGVTAVLVPSAYVLWEVLRGRISDIHVPLREQRMRPLAVALACTLLVLGFFIWWPAPPDFRMLALAYGLQAVLFFVITLRWKISLHSAAAGSLTALGWMAMSNTGVALVALSVPVIAWSRVRLHRHTTAQTVCGALLGAAVVIISFWMIGEA
jgi:hypothetical protein